MSGVSEVACGKLLVDEPAPRRASCFLSADLCEGVRAFADKRDPQWTGG